MYGYNILACDQTPSSGKAYIVSNALPYRNYKPDADDIQAKEIQKIVLLLILTHIYMSDGPVPDGTRQIARNPSLCLVFQRPCIRF